MKGRPITRSLFERTQDLQRAIRRSAFTQQEVMDILNKWYGAPPVAPGEQPQICPSCELETGKVCDKCHNCSDCCRCLLAPHLHAPAPPAPAQPSLQTKEEK